MNILIAGDLFISDNFEGKNLIDDSIIELFEKADYRIVNQEAPITADIPGNKILKTGPHLRTSEKTTIPFLKQLKVDMVTLANNHILDYGSQGLNDTFNTLRKNKIDFVGAGKNINEATKLYTIEKDDLKIAILNFAENEWSIAEKNKPGANPLDIIDNVTQIKAAKATHDKVICIIHGGHEYYHLPSPRMVKQYRFYAENGADAIVGHHTHCIGGYEIYNDVPIIYSLANFLFTLPSKRDEWYTGLLAELKIEKDKTISFELFPINQQKETFKINQPQQQEKQQVLQQVIEFSKIISNGTVLQNYWEDFVQGSKHYLIYFSPLNAINNKYIRGLINRIGINKILLNQQYLKLILNLIRCEAHVNVAKEYVDEHLKRNK